MITRHVYCYFIQDIIFSEVPFSVVQLLHHAGIVERQSDGQLTKALEKKVNSLDKFVKPGHLCLRISDTIGCLNREWARGVGVALSDRYVDALSSVLGLPTECRPIPR